MTHTFTNPLEKIILSNTADTVESLTADLLAGRIRRANDGTNPAAGRQVAINDMGDGSIMVAESAIGDSDADGVDTNDDLTPVLGSRVTIYSSGMVVRVE